MTAPAKHTPLRVTNRSGSPQGFDLMAGTIRIASIGHLPDARTVGERIAARYNAHDDLLAALREGRDFVEGCVPKDDDLLARLNAAIAKAEGRAL